ncbi:MAG: sugar transferase [Rubricella sp.]
MKPTIGERALALLLLAAALPVMAAIALAILVVDGRPILYRSPRCGAGGALFPMFKFRTMQPGAEDGTASGGHKRCFVTRTGAALRATHLDELPQLANVLRGEMRFVGYRAPLPGHVALDPVGWRPVLEKAPGLTGLATLLVGPIEARVLSELTDPGAVEALYLSRFVPAKRRLDLAYAERRCVRSDVSMVMATLLAVLFPRGGLSQKIVKSAAGDLQQDRLFRGAVDQCPEDMSARPVDDESFVDRVVARARRAAEIDLEGRSSG